MKMIDNLEKERYAPALFDRKKFHETSKKPEENLFSKFLPPEC
jgi:hypothetical protein